MKRSSIIHLLIILLAATIAGIAPFLLLNNFSDNFGDISQFQTNLANTLEATIDQTQKAIHAPAPLINKELQNDSILSINGVLTWTNNNRREQEVGILKLDASLNSAAQAKIEDMFTNQYFEHVSPTGLGPSHWVDSAGYEYVSVGENLALGNYDGDEALVTAWMNSPGHRANILNKSFEEIGIAVKKGVFDGVETWLAVQIFAKPLASCPPVNKTLEATIEKNQAQLEIWDTEIITLQVKLEKSKPRGRSSQAEIDKYNALVSEYNQLAKSYNALTEETKKLVDQYNAQVNAFNVCAGE